MEDLFREFNVTLEGENKVREHVKKITKEIDTRIRSHAYAQAHAHAHAHARTRTRTRTYTHTHMRAHARTRTSYSHTTGGFLFDKKIEDLFREFNVTLEGENEEREKM